MKILPSVPKSVEIHRQKYCSAISGGFNADQVAAWERFVTDNRMIDFYDEILKRGFDARSVLDVAATKASIDYRKLQSAKDGTVRILERVEKHAKQLADDLYELEDTTARASLAGDDEFEAALNILISSKDLPGRLVEAAQNARSHDLFSMNLVTERATSSRQRGRLPSFWRALDAELSLMHGANPNMIPLEGQLTANAIAGLCACALGLDEVTEENIKKLRQRDNSR